MFISETFLHVAIKDRFGYINHAVNKSSNIDLIEINRPNYWNNVINKIMCTHFKYINMYVFICVIA